MDNNQRRAEKKILFEFKLYIVHHSSSSKQAITNLKDFLDKEFKGKYKLDIIDVIKNPDLAEDDKIIATPTLLKQYPEPVKKLIGDLRNCDKMLSHFDL